MKKNIFVFLALLLAFAQFLPTVANANAAPEKIDEEYSPLEDEAALQIAKEYGITEEQMLLIDQEIDKLIKDGKLINEDEYTIYAEIPYLKEVSTIVSAVVALGLGFYAAGKYAARQVEVKLGVSPSEYKKWRWGYYGAVSIIGGPIMAQGFDDYFYGI
ncbi:hypothetical protein MKZ26_16460 [Sporosarcina sp. FSL K6-6792]|uniref:hypothetical protein n=1 Tax=Sporosarcina sp. FSL K6-6792 TaxID=2921559 RepID=UPI0030FBCF34